MTFELSHHAALDPALAIKEIEAEINRIQGGEPPGGGKVDGSLIVTENLAVGGKLVVGGKDLIDVVASIAARLAALEQR